MSKNTKVQTNVRLSSELHKKFTIAVKRGNYCKSAVLRDLVANWCEEQGEEG